MLMDRFPCCINMHVAASCCRLELSAFQPRPRESAASHRDLEDDGSVLWLSRERHTDLNKAEKHTGC